MRVLFAIACSFLLVCVRGLSEDDDEWIDPTDMLNYDPATKTMRKRREPESIKEKTGGAVKESCPVCPDVCKDQVTTLQKEWIKEKTGAAIQESCPVIPCPDVSACKDQVTNLQKEVEEQKRNLESAGQQAVSGPIFKRYLTRVLKAIQKLGLPSVTNNIHYDAEMKISEQALNEIQMFLDGDDSWRTGALDEALGQLLVNLKHHDYEAWKWQFEDTFGVDLGTLMGVCVCLMIVIVIICTEMWSIVSWFVQFKRLFAISIIISLAWNWIYLYTVEYAEHQNKVMKMATISEKCSGLKEFDWQDNLSGWFRRTWTLQDDPCSEYYKVLIVNPILLVPPNKAISLTFTCFFTDPLKHIGQGISEFLKALLKDLPITLQIPVLLTIVFSILIFMYGSAQAFIQHGIPRPRLGGNRDSPPPAMEQPIAQRLRGAEDDQQGGGDAHIQALPRRAAASQAGDGDGARQRMPTQRRRLEDLGPPDHSSREDEEDTEQHVAARRRAEDGDGVRRRSSNEDDRPNLGPAQRLSREDEDEDEDQQRSLSEPEDLYDEQPAGPAGRGESRATESDSPRKSDLEARMERSQETDVAQPLEASKSVEDRTASSADDGSMTCPPIQETSPEW